MMCTRGHCVASGALVLYGRGHCVASDANAFYRNDGAMSSDKLSDSGSEYVPGFCDE